MMKVFRLERTQLIPRPRSEVFAFFSDAGNLERLTPDFLNFRILTPTSNDVRAGVLIDYELTLYHVPIRWRTQIESFEPESFFTDIQLSGPYRYWHHRHEFSDVPGGTAMRDIVDYEVPLGPLGQIANQLFVRHSLGQIFAYRYNVVADIFGSYAGGGSEATSPARARIATNPIISAIHNI